MPTPARLASVARRVLVTRTPQHALVLAVDAAYRAWAHARRLDGAPGSHRFRGEAIGRNVAFFTGLSGTKPIQVELTVEGRVPVAQAILIGRRTRPTNCAAQALARLFEGSTGATLESVGVTAARTRLRLAPLAPPHVIEAALEELCAILRRLEG